MYFQQLQNPPVEVVLQNQLKRYQSYSLVRDYCLSITG